MQGCRSLRLSKEKVGTQALNLLDSGREVGKLESTAWAMGNHFKYRPGGCRRVENKSTLHNW